jgi:hypothetical protein
MVNRYSVLLKFLVNSNPHSVFKFEGKKNYCSYLVKCNERVVRHKIKSEQATDEQA